MSIRTAAIGLTTLLASATLAVPAAAPAFAAPGTTSLATVLAADGKRFDANHRDFDILDRAVRTVLGAKPDSPVAVLADGNTRLTAFIPTDRAFMRLARSLTGKRRRVGAVPTRRSSTVNVTSLDSDVQDGSARQEPVDLVHE